MDNTETFRFSASFKPFIFGLVLSLAAAMPTLADDSAGAQIGKTDASAKAKAKTKVLKTKPAHLSQTKDKVSKPASAIVPNQGSAKPLVPQPKQVMLNNQAPVQPSTLRFKLNGPLQGGVSVDVPHTPDQVTQYLIKMRGIIRDYENLAVSQLLGSDGIRTDAASIGAVQNQTLSMIQQIRAIVPPGQLKDKHNELASTLAYVSPYVENPFRAGSGFEALAQLAPVLSRLHDTLERYHSGVRNCIAYYELSPDLDPFYGESEETKQRLNSAIAQTKDSLMNGPASGSGEGQGMDMGSIGNLLNSLGAGGGGSSGSLGNMDSLKGLQGMDLNGLVKQLSKGGALPGGLTGGAPGAQPGTTPGTDGDSDSLAPNEQAPSNSNTLGDVNQMFEEMQNR